MRDKTDRKDILLRNLEDAELSIIRYKKKIQLGEDRMGSFRGLLPLLFVQTLLCKYSLGYETIEIKKSFLNNLDCYLRTALYPSKVKDSYIMYLQVISMSVLFDIEDALFEEIVAVWKTNKWQDSLVDRLIVSRIPDHEVSKTLLFPSPYAEALDILNETDTEVALKLLTAYLKSGWYTKHKTCVWYNSHNNSRNGLAYSGYWSLEAAAIAKILGISVDPKLKLKYFPYDLL
jgi:hypothetical protein